MSATTRARRGRVYLVAGILIAALSGTAPTGAWADPPATVLDSPRVTATAGTLQSMDGSVTLWSLRADAPRRVASTIKMLNALVVRENAELSEVVIVPARAAAIWDGEVGLVTGQRLTVDELLQMMMVASANDAAEALAIHIGGSEARYVRMMNAKARQLGLTRTRAADPHGLSKRERSTASDLAVLAREVLKDPVLRRMVMQRSVSVPRRDAKPRVVKSTDLLLGAYNGIVGVKTGFTHPAGYCFVSAARRGNVELVGVVLGTRSNKARFAETRRLLDWGFAHYHNRVVVSKDETAAIVAVRGGLSSAVTVRPATSFEAVEFDGDPFTPVSRIASATTAPIGAGQQLGDVLVIRGGSVVETIPLVADRAVAAAPAPVKPSVIVGLSRAIDRLVDLWVRLTGLGRKSARAPGRQASLGALVGVACGGAAVVR